MIARLRSPIALLAVAATFACCCADPPRATAINPVKPICSLAGLISGLAGKICSAASHGKRILDAGKKLLGGHLGGAVKSLTGNPVTKTLTITAALGGLVAWVYSGAKFALQQTASVISSTTKPQLGSTWFSGFYWRMAGVSALLTLPFLFAAAIQALVRSDMSLLLRSAFGYLPLGLLAVAIAAPLTTLLLAGSDELSQIVSGAAGNADGAFLAKASLGAGALSLVSHSPFIAFFVGLLAAAATLVLWCELLIRSAAVYVIVLMLPLFFAALVWPARRVWAIRAIELLVALILSKFAIVAVLALGGAAIGHTAIPSVTQMLAGATLVLLAALSPWALLRLLPLHELAAGAAGGLRTRSQGALALEPAEGATEIAQEHAARLLSRPDPDPEPPAQTIVDRLDVLDRRDGGGDGAQPVVEGEAVDAFRSGSEDDAGDEPEASSHAVAAAPAAPPQSAAPSPGARSAPQRADAGSDSSPDPAAAQDLSPQSAGLAATPHPDQDVAGERRRPVERWQNPIDPSTTLHLASGADWQRTDEPAGLGDRPEPPQDHDPLPPAQEPADGQL